MRHVLTQRNLDIIFDIARFQLLTSKQVGELHFQSAKHPAVAAANVLRRLEAGSYVMRTYTQGRAQRGEKGLISLTKPENVWYFPAKCQKALLVALKKQARADEFEDIASYQKNYNHQHSYSNQSLHHELGINYVLMSLERAIEQSREYSDFHWIRTSPRHDLTSTKVTYEQGKRKYKGNINPDAFLFFRDREQVWRFFYLEYNSGTDDEYAYRDKKLLPAWHYWKQGRREDKQYEDTRYFYEVARDVNSYLDLRLASPDLAKLQFLSVSGLVGHAHKIFMASTAIPTSRLFYFTDLDSLRQNPLGEIWLRKKEFESTPYQETLSNGETETYPSLLDKYHLLLDEASPHKRRAWVDEVATTVLPRVTLT